MRRTFSGIEMKIAIDRRKSQDDAEVRQIARVCTNRSGATAYHGIVRS
jgi:hypothetical protein